jgi:prepilin-type N-terminal cleavage/methylation domain-containing protein
LAARAVQPYNHKDGLAFAAIDLTVATAIDGRRTMRKHAHGTRGVTLVELMIVVVIIGILAAISTVGYRKYIGRARTSEASAMLAEFAAKEQLYFMDSGQYIEAHATSSDYPSLSEDANQFYPSDPGASFDSVRTPVSLLNGDNTSSLPDSWKALGMRPRWNSLYCTYLANAGPPSATLAGTVGPTLWVGDSNPPKVPWFYAIGACNLGGIAGWPNTGAGHNYVSTFVLTHDSPALHSTDEDR